MKISLLLGVLCKSSSFFNQIKSEEDKKKKNKLIGTAVGLGFAFLILGLYLVMMGIALGYYGFAETIPSLMVMMASLLVFILSLFKVNGYLFGGTDYEMLLALPFTIQEIVTARYLYLYVNELPWCLGISICFLPGYAIFGNPSSWALFFWGILSFLIPAIPLFISSLVGTFIAGVSAGFRFKKLVTAIFTFAFILLCFFSRFIIEAIFEENEIENLVDITAEKILDMEKMYWPAKWFREAVTNQSISSLFALLAVVLLFGSVVIRFISVFYRQINSKLANVYMAKNYTMSRQKRKSVVSTVAFKEFRLLLDNSNYLINGGTGVIFILIFMLGVLFVSPDKIMEALLRGAPVDKAVVLPAIPLILYFFSGMVATTCISPSLEGRSAWIMSSLPVKKIDDYKGKMLFNLLLFEPISLLACVILSIRFGANPVQILAFAVCNFACNVFSTTWGMVCGIKHRKTDWERDIEVIKQGTAVTLYLLPNMFVVMALIAGSIALGFVMDPALIALIVTVLAGILALLSYHSVQRLAKLPESNG